MKFTLNVLKPYQKNEIFNSASPLNRDDYLYSFRKLKEEFEKHGHEFNTQDVTPKDQSDGTIYIDMPSPSEIAPHSYLILQESEVVRPDNYLLDNHRFFKKIFTWKSELVDDIKYFKLNFCHHIFEPYNEAYFSDKRLLVMVSGNKSSRHSKELYSERKKAIREIENLIGHEFAYYGPGWERFYLSNTKILKAFKKAKIEWILPLQKTSSYEGLLEHKIKGMNHFRFCLCFENAKDIPGYITEKIFDCFFASVVPIYWGAPDIAEYIPVSAYIDFRKFKNISDLVNTIKNMDQGTFDLYLDTAKKFLKSEKVKSFSGEHFAKTIVDRVLDI
ncbi:MAG: hypothetical protein KDD34_04305 [Bdellovibrionales bacterium]|nr:hypothetical protein [Bdellovibrionales bacterium]